MKKYLGLFILAILLQSIRRSKYYQEQMYFATASLIGSSNKLNFLLPCFNFLKVAKK